MAKKKKALKPVVRGFATVSVPKKPVPSEQPQDTTEDAGDPPSVQSSDTPTVSVVPPQTDLAVLEESALQAIVEKFQDKTEKDIVRGVKVRYHICRKNKLPEPFRSRAGDRTRAKVRSNATCVGPGSRVHGPDSRVGVGRGKDRRRR